MARVFETGKHLYISSQIKAHVDPALDSSVKFVEPGYKCIVYSYNKKGTEENIEDDFTQIKVSEGPQKDQTFWVPKSEFSKLHNV